MNREKATSILLSFLGIIVFLGIWQLVASLHLVPSFFLPSPRVVLDAIVSLATQGSLFTDIGASLFRIIAGFLVSIVIALPLGIIFGTSKKTEAVAEPIVAFVRYIPPSAFIPLIIVWLGVGEWGKIVLIFFGVAPYLTLLVADTVHAIRKELIEAAVMLGASKSDLIFKVVLPYSMPAIWDSFRIMFGAAWTFVIIAEILGSSSGLGHLMIESQRFLRTDNIFAGIVVIGVLGILTDYFFKATARVMFPWNRKIHVGN
jgi:NitT/TauT family transport system permease protein